LKAQKCLESRGRIVFIFGEGKTENCVSFVWSTWRFVSEQWNRVEIHLRRGRESRPEGLVPTSTAKLRGLACSLQ
jgi:hypothetical protein